MFIKTEVTPNPATMKFMPGQEIAPDKPYDFKSDAEAGASPLAQRLFGLQGVSGVFLGSDFVAVSKSDDTDWNMLQPMVVNAMMEHLSTGQPIVEKGEEGAKTASDKKRSAEDQEVIDQIKELLDTRVRPMVMQDGGDIVFEDYDDGIVYLQMRGACSGCPSSTATLKDGIENMLQHFIPEVREVRPAAM